MSFSVTILGCNSAVPAHGRHPSAQVVTIHHKPFLVDCGEGTQMRLMHYGVKWSRINDIFISHLHGDHYFGLIGLISTFHLLKRLKPLHVYGPEQLLPILTAQLEAGQTNLSFELVFHALNLTVAERILETEQITVDTIILKHRIGCTGFLFREKQSGRKIIKAKLDEFDIPYTCIPDLKKGFDVLDTSTGEKIANALLTSSPYKARSYAYCCDTAFNPAMASQIKEVDLLYHDCTFDKQGEARAAVTFHSTTHQAAEIAKLSLVKQLLIGHFSSKYDELFPLLDEAKQIFEQTLLAVEGQTYSIER